MIRPRKKLASLQRDVQIYDSRGEMLRLDMNEYVPYADETLYQALLERITFETISGYPLVNRAYGAISEFINQPIGKIVLTPGSDGVIFSTLMAFCESGDTVGYIEPSYGMYGVYCDMLGVKKKCVSYDAAFQINIDDILNMIDETLKVLMIANPNGVLGTEIPASKIEEIVRKGNETGTIILLDEVHADFVDNGCSDYAYLTEKYDNFVIARSFSKSYGLAGIRAGYALAHRETRKYLISVRSNVEISSVASLAIQVWCEHKEAMLRSIDAINQSKALLCEEFTKRGFCTYNGGGNFIVVKPPEPYFALFRDALEENKIKIKYLSGAFDGWTRITVGTEAYMKRLIDIIKENFG